MAFKKAKITSSVHDATFKSMKKRKIKQKKQTVKGKIKQIKVSSVRTPKQKLTQPAGVPPQKRQEYLVAVPKQKKTFEEADDLMRRIHNATS